MGEDLSAGIKIAIVIIILCAITSIVFSLFTIMKNLTNEATADFQNGANALKNLYWDDYNQKTVTGNQVTALLRTAREKELAIVIRTTRSAGAPLEATMGVNYGVSLAPYRDAKTDSTGLTVYTSAKDIVTTDDYAGQATRMDVLFYDTKENVYRTNPYKASGSTDLTFNTNYKGTTDKQSTLYINPNNDFMAHLILDTTGTKIGVFFDQKG